MARKRVTLHQHHRRWAMWTAGVVFVAAVAGVIVAFSREDKVDAEPWGYVALAIAILSALAGLLLSFTQAVFESQGED